MNDRCALRVFDDSPRKTLWGIFFLRSFSLSRPTPNERTIDLLRRVPVKTNGKLL